MSATSTDTNGTSFVPDAGNRITGGYVDSDVIQAKNGDWLMLLSTGPGEPPQRFTLPRVEMDWHGKSSVSL